MLLEGKMAAAAAAARKAFEEMYTGICTVTCTGECTNSGNSPMTGQEEVVLLENQPCRLSFEKNHRGMVNSTDTDTAAYSVQLVKLFLSPETVIPPGSRVRAEQDGRSFHFKSSGQPALFATHQEIVLRPVQEKV